MKNGTKKILIVGGAVGVAALGWWYFNRAPASPAPGSAASELPTGAVSSTIATPGAITVPTAASQTIPAIDPKVLTAVQAWGDADGRAPVVLMVNAEVPSEYAGMYDIITNLWGVKGAVETAAQQTFWNALRKKYDAMTSPLGTW